MAGGVITRMLEVACRRCERRGRLSIARLIAEHGDGVLNLPAIIAADCPRLNINRRGAVLTRPSFAGLALLLMLALVVAAPAQAGSNDDPERPYSCHLYDAEQRKCAFDPQCDRRPVERLRMECLRDGARPGYSRRR